MRASKHATTPSLPPIWLMIAMWSWTMIANAHMAIISPQARHVYFGVGLIQNSYTTFGGPGDVYGNNANVFGGSAGATQIATYGYDVCGDDGRRKAFSLPTNSGYAPSPPQATIVAGEEFDVVIKVTAHHYGWFEFRICAPPAGGTVVTEETPACFKENILQLAATQYYNESDMMPGVRSVFDFEGTADAGYTFQHAKCQQGPPDTCCDPNSGCSPEDANVNRFMLPRPGVDDNIFTVRLIAPNVVCDRCTMQVLYRTGNSPDSYPETFWNCADITMTSSSSQTSSPTLPPSSHPSTVSTASPTPANSPATHSPSSTTGKPTATPSRAATNKPVSNPTKKSTNKPTTRPSKPTTHAPTSKTPSPTMSSCATTWAQCGGSGYTGPTCCSQAIDVCVYTNENWSMCTPKTSIPGATTAPSSGSLRTNGPTTESTGTGCAPTWAQCGGESYTGATCCSSPGDACVYQSQWYSQCQPKST